MKLDDDVFYELKYELGRLGYNNCKSPAAYRKGDAKGESQFNRQRNVHENWFETSVILKNGEKWYVGCVPTK